MKTLRWLFWSAVYLFRPQPKELLAFLVRGHRTMPPWWKFRPCVYRDARSHCWKIDLTDEEDYRRGILLPVIGHFVLDGNRLVGFTLHDEYLEVDGTAAFKTHYPRAEEWGAKLDLEEKT